MKKISVIGPCFNEEKNLDDFLFRLKKILQELSVDYTIILIDDGSSDNTWKKICEFSNKDNKIFGIKLTRNFGHQSAISSGLKYANGDYIFVTDVDLQDPPELIKDMYEKALNENFEVVFGKRVKNSESGFKKITSLFFYKIFNLISETKIAEQTSDFVLLNKKVKEEIVKLNQKDIFFRGLIPWLGFRIGYVEFSRNVRTRGKTGYSFNKMIDLTMTAFLSYSKYPMRFPFYLSMTSGFAFFLFLIYGILSYLTDDVIKGWTSIFMVISFFGIIIFFILGLLSEYLGRIYSQIQSKPSFIIETFSRKEDFNEKSE